MNRIITLLFSISLAICIAQVGHGEQLQESQSGKPDFLTGKEIRAKLSAIFADGVAITFTSRDGKYLGRDNDFDLKFEPANLITLTEYGYGISMYDGTYAVAEDGTISVSLADYEGRLPDLRMAVAEGRTRLYPKKSDNKGNLDHRFKNAWPFRLTNAVAPARSSYTDSLWNPAKDELPITPVEAIQCVMQSKLFTDKPADEWFLKSIRMNGHYITDLSVSAGKPSATPGGVPIFELHYFIELVRRSDGGVFYFTVLIDGKVFPPPDTKPEVLNPVATYDFSEPESTQLVTPPDLPPKDNDQQSNVRKGGRDFSIAPQEALDKVFANEQVSSHQDDWQITRFDLYAGYVAEKGNPLIPVSELEKLEIFVLHFICLASSDETKQLNFEVDMNGKPELVFSRGIEGTEDASTR